LTLRFSKKTQLAGMIVFTLVPVFAFGVTSPFGGTPVLYDSGSPTASEQLILERINRARADPGAEATRLGIGLNDGLAAGTIQNTPKPPLANHPRILIAARNHTQWMFDTNTFSHTGAGGSTAKQRMESAGYVFTGTWRTGENIAGSSYFEPAGVPQVLHDNLFKSASHRVSICNANYVETALGLSTGIFPQLSTTNQSMLVTNKFATSDASPGPFLVGVAYYDFNGNLLYDEGEGIPGMHIHVEGATRYAVSAGAGGFAIPVPSTAATRRVAFSFGSYQQIFQVGFPGGINVKRDLRLTYQPPVVSGPAEPPSGKAGSYQVSAVPGVPVFRMRVHAAAPVAADPADQLSRVVVQSWRATPLSTTVKYSGSAAYHLTHVQGHTADQLTYASSFLAGTNAAVTLRSRLGYATSGQVARVQVSTDGGSSWSDVYTQAGSGSSGESAFQFRNISLAAYAGRKIDIRLRYDRGSTSTYYAGTDNIIGWYVDELAFNNLDALEVVGETPDHPSDTPFSFTPPGHGRYTISAKPAGANASWGEGPALVVQPAPNSFTTWATDAEAAAGLAPGTLANSPLADPNGDGLPNLIAYFLGLSATERSAHLAPKLAPIAGGYRMIYWQDTTAGGGVLTVEVSQDLKTWRAPGEPGFPTGLTDVATHQENSRQYRALTIPASMPGMFVRLRGSVVNP
jgi:uncharacterized protein YkwD